MSEVKLVYWMLWCLLPVSCSVCSQLCLLPHGSRVKYAVIFFHSKSFADICLWSSSDDGRRKTFIHERKHTQSLQASQVPACVWSSWSPEKSKVTSVCLFFLTVPNLRFVSVPSSISSLITAECFPRAFSCVFPLL